MSRLRVACVGTGFIAGRHLSALTGFDDVEIVAVADAVPERAADTAARYGARAYPDGSALLESEELDAVWLCVPPFAHGPLEAAALERRLPFFVEKPLASDLATAVQIAGAVREAHLVTAVGYHWRHLDLVHQAAGLLVETPAQLVTGHWLDKTPPVPWWSQRTRSGGQVLEQTTHVFDLARLLVGEVDTITAAERTASRQHGDDGDVPTAASALLTFASGAVGTISSARILGRRHRVGLQLVAEGRAIDISERGLTDHELRVATATGERVDQSIQDPISREDREFLDVLLGRAPHTRVPYQEALRSHALAWAADRSAREGGPIRPDQQI
ncbi:Predicted dehydrogenase [Modestobacter sp. DSM 44400]|uniref:Gfo/Idh/MocA family protein n=1 Tax=Modestobacter sp. DSM 44400 TaxID=1550230 RepID=UPI00089CC157|nr:Gfo/Idh/MocA family oxidoreductase [Modestobacter sp. DSM 44400]SDX91299.1 Predicted dehydrogenase [Modestobacter sp. DSM 44400]